MLGVPQARWDMYLSRELWVHCPVGRALKKPLQNLNDDTPRSGFFYIMQTTHLLRIVVCLTALGVCVSAQASLLFWIIRAVSKFCTCDSSAALRLCCCWLNVLLWRNIILSWLNFFFLFILVDLLWLYLFVVCGFCLWWAFRLNVI